MTWWMVAVVLVVAVVAGAALARRSRGARSVTPNPDKLRKAQRADESRTSKYFRPGG